MTPRRLTSVLSVLTHTLEVKAELAKDAVDPATAFDPTRPSSTGLGPKAGDIPRRHPRRAVEGRSSPLVAAAAAVVLALVGAAAVALSGEADDPPVSTAMLDAPPEGWLVPTWVPEGLEVWGIEWESEAANPMAVSQLLGDPGGGRAIFITTYSYGMKPDTGEPVTVRGETGEAGTGWDVDETELGDALAWEERGLDLTALYQGVGRDEAIAVLDSLEWRSDDPVDGFAPLSDGSWPLRAEINSQQTASRGTYLTYSDGPPAADRSAGGLRLDIQATASTAVSSSYLAAWYQQGPQAGGGTRPLVTFDEFHHLIVVWPDGRSIDIYPYGVPQADLPSQATLQRIAESIMVAGEAELAAQRDVAQANVAGLPALASAETGVGSVDLHGEGRFLQLCLRRPAAVGPSCAADMGGGVMTAEGRGLATAEWTIDGDWYVAVASTGEVPRIVGGADPTSAPDAGELPTETFTDGDWTIQLVRAEADIRVVCTRDGGNTSCNHHRR